MSELFMGCRHLELAHGGETVVVAVLEVDETLFGGFLECKSARCHPSCSCSRGEPNRAKMVVRGRAGELPLPTEAVQERLDKNPEAMRVRRETAEHPFGTLKARMGTTPLLMKTLPKVATEMALSVLAYNFTRVMNILGTKPLMAALAA